VITLLSIVLVFILVLVIFNIQYSPIYVFIFRKRQGIHILPTIISIISSTIVAIIIGILLGLLYINNHTKNVYPPSSHNHRITSIECQQKCDT